MLRALCPVCKTENIYWSRSGNRDLPLLLQLFITAGRCHDCGRRAWFRGPLLLGPILQLPSDARHGMDEDTPAPSGRPECDSGIWDRDTSLNETAPLARSGSDPPPAAAGHAAPATAGNAHRLSEPAAGSARAAVAVRWASGAGILVRRGRRWVYAAASVLLLGGVLIIAAVAWRKGAGPEPLPPLAPAHVAPVGAVEPVTGEAAAHAKSVQPNESAGDGPQQTGSCPSAPATPAPPPERQQDLQEPDLDLQEPEDAGGDRGAAAASPSAPPAEQAIDGESPVDGDFEGLRVWRDADRSREAHARLLAADGADITLMKENGDVVRVPLRLLSEEDQQYVRAWMAAERVTRGFAPGDRE